MSNALIRSGSSYSVPAVQAALAQPAYSYFVSDTLQTFAPSGPNIPTGWGYRNVVLANGATSLQLVYLGTVPGGAVSPPVTPTFNSSSSTVTRRVDVPGVAAVAGSEASKVNLPPLGWTSFAHSVRTIRAGSARWKIDPASAGAVVGFSVDPSPTVGYGHIRHGFLFTGKRAKHLRSGEDYGEFTANDVFEIIVQGNVANYLRNDEVYHSEPLRFNEVQPLMLSAALYGPSDKVDSPLLAEVLGGGGAPSLPALRVFASDGELCGSTAALPALTLQSRAANAGHGALPALECLGSDRAVYGASAEALPALIALAYGGTLAISSNNGGDTRLPALIGAGHMLVGGIGSSETSLGPLSTIAADHNYGGSAASLPALGVAAFVEPRSEAFITEVLAVPDRLDASHELLVLMVGGVGVSSTLLPTRVMEALLDGKTVVLDSLLGGQIADAVLWAIAHSSGLLGVPFVGSETFVWNEESGGTTTYSNFGFNSFATIGNRFYGANESGIYLLEGDDDAGAAIRASISLGTLDFGTAVKKTVQEMYIGVSAKGNIFVKTVTLMGTFTYRTRSSDVNIRQQRATFGKGLRTNYMTLELYNEDGADFELDTVQFVVADLVRKI